MSLFLNPRGSRRATEGPGATERTAITEGTQVTECHGLRSPVYRMKESCYSTATG